MPDTNRISISSENLDDGTVVVKPVGTLDVFTFIELKNYIGQLCAPAEIIRMVVDLSLVEYIASSGWSVLLSRRQSIKRDGGELSVCGMNENLRRVYDSMKIDKMLPSAGGLVEAVALVKSSKA
jgi:anti-sigma B factor antagonist